VAPRRAIGAAGAALPVEQIAQCLVRLKSAIGGTFRVVEVTPEASQGPGPPGWSCTGAAQPAGRNYLREVVYRP
jgi:hypothetical protein